MGGWVPAATCEGCRGISLSGGVGLGAYPLFLSPVLSAGGVDRLLARSGVPTPGGVRARAVIDDRTRNIHLHRAGCEDSWAGRRQDPKE